MEEISIRFDEDLVDAAFITAFVSPIDGDVSGGDWCRRSWASSALETAVRPGTSQLAIR